MVQNSYEDFIKRLRLLIEKHPDLIITTLSNIFTMRLIGNKTHGDLAEIAMVEFINQYMYDFRSVHVGKDLYRAKSKEEDIKIINEITEAEFPVSLKAYGDGPLQLLTDKDFKMFPRLEQENPNIGDKGIIDKIFSDDAFSNFGDTCILSLIYDEETLRCNILVFNFSKAKKETARISRGRGKKYPRYTFYDRKDSYICEIRYGGPDANALQRGLWTNTKNGVDYFDSITNGWIDYRHNDVLVNLFYHALVSSKSGHKKALEKIKEDIARLKRNF